MNIFDGTSKKEVILGTTLQDQINGYAGNDTIDSGDGDDILSGSSGRDKLFGRAGNDLIDAGTGDDYISDGDGNDTVFAGDGNDFVKAGRGDDIFHGGKGFDTIDFSEAKTAMAIDLSKGVATGRGTDVVQGFERVIGSSLADNIKGSSGVDVIEAGEGRNVIRSLGGEDVISGGTGRDTFVFATSDVVDGAGRHLGVDTIRGFEGNDAIDLRGMLKGIDVEDLSVLDDLVHLTDTAAGTMVQVKVGEQFVDVALLEGYMTGGASASAWAADGLILAG